MVMIMVESMDERFPASAEEILEIINEANKEKKHIRTRNQQGNSNDIYLNKSKMNNIIDIDSKNYFITLEPGITYKALKEAMKGLGVKILYPLNATSEFVLENFVKQSVLLSNVSQKCSQISNLEVALPNGLVYSSGASSLSKHNKWREDGGPNLYRLFLESGENLGIIVQGTIFAYPLSPTKLIGVAFDSFPEALTVSQKLSRLAIGEDILILNKNSLETKINQTVSKTWYLFININENYYEYQSKKVIEEAKGKNLIETVILDKFNPLLDEPWINSKAKSYVSFYTLYSDVPICYETINLKVNNYQCEIVPIERGRSIFLQFSFNKDEKMKNELIRDLLQTGKCVFNEINENTLEIYNKNKVYAKWVSNIKQELDPNNILNPNEWIGGK